VSKKTDDADQEIDLEEIREFYDEVYYSEASASDATRIPRHYFRLFKRLGISRGANVLDVACGTGEWLDACAREDCSVSGVDLSAKAIAVCRERLPKGEFYAQPAETLPFDDDSFDVVTCLGSLEHFVDPVSSLKEMVRVARADARVVILVPNKDFLTRKLGLFGGTYQVDAKEVVRTLEEWDALFVAGGLSVTERWKDLHVLTFSWIKKGKLYMWPLRALQGLLLAIWPLRWQYQVYHRCVVSS
jgi:ubiquinone/menaquinone biosynthesis C-methylase UbiE